MPHHNKMLIWRISGPTGNLNGTLMVNPRRASEVGVLMQQNFYNHYDHKTASAAKSRWLVGAWWKVLMYAWHWIQQINKNLCSIKHKLSSTGNDSCSLLLLLLLALFLFCFVYSDWFGAHNERMYVYYPRHKHYHAKLFKFKLNISFFAYSCVEALSLLSYKIE